MRSAVCRLSLMTLSLPFLLAACGSDDDEDAGGGGGPAAPRPPPTSSRLRASRARRASRP